MFVDAGTGAAAASSEPEKPEQQWSTHHSVGPSGATIGVVCAVVVVLLVVATLVHWLHRSGRLPCCTKCLDEATDGEAGVLFVWGLGGLPVFCGAARQLAIDSAWACLSLQSS